MKTLEIRIYDEIRIEDAIISHEQNEFIFNFGFNIIERLIIKSRSFMYGIYARPPTFNLLKKSIYKC